MPKELRFSQQKLDEVNKLIKGGYSEDDAFNRAGITEDEYGLYQLDDKGRVTKAFDTIEVRTKEEEAAREAEDARRTKEQEERRARREEEIKVDREKNLERLKKKREEEKAAAKKGWSDEEDKSETTGPSNTRGDVTTTVSGGGSRETRMTAEMSDWTDKNNQARKADDKATQDAKNEYLRSLGLENSNFREKNKALRAAEAEGKNFNVTTNRDALGAPPANQYEEITIRPNTSGAQKSNDGEQTDDQAAKTAAAGQTAEDKVKNDILPPDPGAGNASQTATTDPSIALVPAAVVSQAEADKIKNNQSDAAAKDEIPANSLPAPAPAENTLVDPNVAALERRRENSVKGTTSVANSSSIDGNASKKQQELSYKLALAKTNKLHDYASYTYRLTLYLLSSDDYAALIDKPSSFNPQFALISSGGGYNNDPTMSTQSRKRSATDPSGRHPDFQEDFYIESLNLHTVVGLNAKSKASNAIDISFSIIEPYGMTLLDRLLSACSTPPVNSTNYIDQPYLLEIDFLGNPGEQVKKSQSDPTGIRIDRKRIAIKIIEMKIKPGPGGTEYKCRAIPYNHSAFQDSVASMPVTLGVTAGTLGEFFDSGVEIEKIFTNGIATVNEERVETETKKWAEENFNEMTPATEADLEAQRNKFRASFAVSAKSFPAAYNGYMRSIAGDGKTFLYPPTLVTVNIPDSEMKNSRIVDEKNTEIRTIPMSDPMEGVKASVLAAIQKDGKTKQQFPISPGTNVVQLIDRVMQSSEYITRQVKESQENIASNKEQLDYHSKIKNDNSQTDSVRERSAIEVQKAEEELKKYTFLDWYKLVPQVFLKEFDKSRNAYSKMVTYTILKYKAANSFHPDFNLTKIGKSKIVRSYNYLYTGQNQDILAIDIDFDTAYFTAITAFQDSKQRAGARYGRGINDASNVKSENNTLKDGDSQSGVERIPDVPHTYNTQGANLSNAGQMNRQNNSVSQAVNDIASSIYTSSRGDNLNVKLKITGDPAFIKQDDIYFNPMSPEYQDAVTGSVSGNGKETVPINANTGQIIFDAEQVFVQLLVKSAIDVDDKTGITNKQIILTNGRPADATFSGVYKLISVRSELSKGRFEQTLELVKMPNDMFFDDVVTSDASVQTAVPLKIDDKPAVKPPEQPTFTNTAETTGTSASDLAALKEAAAQPPTNGSPTFSGDGVAVGTTQVTQSSPTNANESPAVAPQQTAKKDFTAELDELEAEYAKITEERRQEFSSFNATLRNIQGDTSLTAAEKADKTIRYREALKEVISDQAKQIQQLTLRLIEVNKQPEFSSRVNKLAKQGAALQKQSTEVFQEQTAKIKKIQETGLV